MSDMLMAFHSPQLHGTLSDPRPLGCAAELLCVDLQRCDDHLDVGLPDSLEEPCGRVRFQLARHVWWVPPHCPQAGKLNYSVDLMNEPHDIPATTVASLMQAGINGVRASGATQLIMVEGTSWTGAWSTCIRLDLSQYESYIP